MFSWSGTGDGSFGLRIVGVVVVDEFEVPRISTPSFSSSLPFPFVLEPLFPELADDEERVVRNSAGVVLGVAWIELRRAA